MCQLHVNKKKKLSGKKKLSEKGIPPLSGSEPLPTELLHGIPTTPLNCEVLGVSVLYLDLFCLSLSKMMCPKRSEKPQKEKLFLDLRNAQKFSHANQW